MDQDFSLFVTITVAVMLAFAGGFVARKLKLRQSSAISSPGWC